MVELLLSDRREDHIIFDPVNELPIISTLSRPVELGRHPCRRRRVLFDDIWGDISQTHQIHAYRLNTMVHVMASCPRTSSEGWNMAVIPLISIYELADQILGITASGQHVTRKFDLG